MTEHPPLAFLFVIASGRADGTLDSGFVKHRGAALLRTLLERLRSSFREKFIVIGSSEYSNLQLVAGRLGAQWINAPDNGQQLLALLQAGLRHLPSGTDTVVLIPVTKALITPETVRTLVQQAQRSTAAVTVATHFSRPGHPIVLRRDAFTKVLALHDNEELQSYLAQHTSSGGSLHIDSIEVVIDVDSEDAFAEHLS